MARHNDIGKLGEKLAAQWLTTNGHMILARNWRHHHAEIDIITTKDKTLYFVEVKTSTNLRYGYPEQRVTRQKKRQLTLAADVYLQQHPAMSHELSVLAICILTSHVTYLLMCIDPEIGSSISMRCNCL